ncbi:hypothetical protein ACE1OC_41390 [Streptomyces sp. DSM 116496]|uniref:hypothetical protein n=1 Tax=Streptomyces stoeckheimensis TaxID=3344656 RepID=UPI0038B2D13C
MPSGRGDTATDAAPVPVSPQPAAPSAIAAAITAAHFVLLIAPPQVRGSFAPVFEGGVCHGDPPERLPGLPVGARVSEIGTVARSNRQKSDQDPATWMPAPAVHCRCIGEWVATKHRRALSVDQAEREALLRYAAACPNAVLAFDRAA